MAKNPLTTDKVRASRDGHEYHEAWTARKALQLLLPIDNFIGIAVEGLSPADHSIAASESVEVADLVLYYGGNATFKGADSVNIIQFKYSVTSSDEVLRCSHAKKTISKFAIAYTDHIKNYGILEVRNKLHFEFITNRPIHPEFIQAIRYIAEKKQFTGEIKNQAEQFKAASKLTGDALVEFANKFQLTGLTGSLRGTKSKLSKTLVDWSAGSDSIARARLGGLKQMVRDKAGSAGQNRNVIRRTDVFEAIEIQSEEDLFPCPDRFPEVGPIVQREQLAEALRLISSLDRPLLIHSEGGVGKTVFLESLVRELSNKHEVVLFDCFGGGVYRAPEDSRHLPKRGLVHIANILACQRRLCDPLLPNNESVDDLIRTFRRRLVQSVEMLKGTSPQKEIVLIIDAIDNAAEQARDRNEQAFPKLLLESFYHAGPIAGVKLIVSCRTHRILISKGDVDCVEFQLHPFTISETEKYLRERLAKVGLTNIQVAQARSGGNARILEHLVNSGRGLLDKSEIDNPITLDELLMERIDQALRAAINRGYKKSDTDSFLAGLAVLPPPVPIDEYAGAYGMDVSAIKSFAADLAPLLEHTKYGLMFRDEPTETLIREKYASDLNALRRVAKNLLARQDSSVYSARALPDLLQKIDDGKTLFKLAFDERFPQSITSTIGKRNIRYARLKAAVRHAAFKKDNNQLVHLLVELSTLAAVDQRGIDYILAYPDLVITAQDVDATRRLVETRTNWPGTRHARLTIANILSGDYDNASLHAVRADEWILHYRQKVWKQGEEHVGPQELDIAAIPFFLVAQNRSKAAILFLKGWKDWYAYEVSEYLFPLLNLIKSVKPQFGGGLKSFLHNLTNEIGVISCALLFLEISNIQCKELIKKLSKACGKIKSIELSNDFRQKSNMLQDGLLKASTIAISLGLRMDALKIVNSVPYERPRVWSFRDPFMDRKIFPFLVHKALVSAINGSDVREKDIFPKELLEFSSDIKDTDELSKNLLKKLEDSFKSKQDQSKDNIKSISYDEKQIIEWYIKERSGSLLILINAFSKVLAAPYKRSDRAFITLLEIWSELRKKSDLYSRSRSHNAFFQDIGLQMSVFVICVRGDLELTSIKAFLERLDAPQVDVWTLIEIVSILSKRNILFEFAGEQAAKTRSLIEKEDEVTRRASLYAQLGRAILPASEGEAAAYFKAGLEQMDAIGSGDYDFINELLIFASSLKGDELAEKDFHTLTNICELNMYEERKFPWFAFAKGLSKTSGSRGLAKLARWNDRSRISLDYTLLPYLTALIVDNKISPETALSLVMLSNPAELYSCGTATLVKSIGDKHYPNHNMLINEMIGQFVDHDPETPMNSTMEALIFFAEKAWGKDSEILKSLRVMYEHTIKISDERGEIVNYRGEPNKEFNQTMLNKKTEDKALLKELISESSPIDEISIGMAVDKINALKKMYDLKDEFFVGLRSKLNFSQRAKYIEIISQLKNLGLYTKLEELKRCKELWTKSSIALLEIYKEFGMPILKLHVEDFISHDQLSGYQLKELAEISEVSIVELVLELIKIFSSPDWNVSASVWLCAATFVCEVSNRGEGQQALTRLLNSGSAKLASSVNDGEWKKGLYPNQDQTELAASFVWAILGSPHADERWRGAHAVRHFAKFEKWDVIDALIKRVELLDAHPFQAPELPFYYLHAKLWLLIALTRIALDNPKRIAKYRNVLKGIVLDDKLPHVLMRNFAAKAILMCVEKKTLKLSSREINQIRNINFSKFPRLNKKLKERGYDSFYNNRPKEIPEPEPKFFLDYDFEKYSVRHLSDVFGKSAWEVKDFIADAVRKYDKKITSMYDDGGRPVEDRNRAVGMGSEFHTYGQQLGWHAMFIAAGRLLSRYPVTEDSYFAGDPWMECLNGWLLTRKDGLWLSDGMDKTPLNAKVNLLEKTKEGPVLTGDKTKILNLINVNSRLNTDFVVEGNWNSSDNIEVDVSSVLISSKENNSAVKELLNEIPFLVYLPTYSKHDEEEEYLRNDKNKLIPWIVCPSVEARLDEHDPLGSIWTMKRPYFIKDIATKFTLKTDDSFGRTWIDSNGKLLAYSDAWGSKKKNENDSSCSGVRFVCSRELLKKVLLAYNADLLILIKLQRYERGFGNTSSKFFNTIAVVRIKKSLELKFFKGSVNKLHQSKY